MESWDRPPAGIAVAEFFERWLPAAFAAAPALALLRLGTSGVILPLAALATLFALEGAGCWFLWRVARIEA